LTGDNVSGLGIGNAVVGEAGNEHVWLDDNGDRREHGEVGRLVVNIVNGGAVTGGGRHATDALKTTIAFNEYVEFVR